MGYTGSTWLAKLLNSHPDVYCSHEGVAERAYPARHYSEEDIVQFVRWLSWDTMHGAYAAIGDVGSIWQTHAVGLRGFQTAVLVRHPARVLNSRLLVYPHDQSFTDITMDAVVRELWGIDMASYDPIDRVFLSDLWIYVSQTWSADRGVRILRIEDMSSRDFCMAELERLTGLQYPAALVEQAISRRVNQRSEPQSIREILAGFTARQREWYRLMLEDAAPLLGYELESDRPALQG